MTQDADPLSPTHPGWSDPAILHGTDTFGKKIREMDAEGKIWRSPVMMIPFGGKMTTLMFWIFICPLILNSLLLVFVLDKLNRLVTVLEKQQDSLKEIWRDLDSNP